MTKTIFITGTSTGLGKLTAIRFAKMGWNVAATMRAPEKETELTAYDNIRLFKLDVTDVGQVRKAVDDAIAAFGKIDVVVNNAGMGTYGALELAEEETIDWQFAVNVRGPINVIRAFLPHYRANGGGMFINISSLMGVTSAVPIGSLYNMSKFALEGLTEGLLLRAQAAQHRAEAHRAGRLCRQQLLQQHRLDRAPGHYGLRRHYSEGQGALPERARRSRRRSARDRGRDRRIGDGGKRQVQDAGRGIQPGTCGVPELGADRAIPGDGRQRV